MIKGSLINTIENQDDENGKGMWTDISDETLIEMFGNIIVNNNMSENNEDYELPAELRFARTKDAEYYAMKFPGFSDEVYQILDEEQQKLDAAMARDMSIEAPHVVDVKSILN